MCGAITEEQDISQTQYLDLVHSQFGTLYDLIPQAPNPSIDLVKTLEKVPVDGIFGSIESPSAAKPARKT